MNREEKKQEIELINDSFKSSQISLCADYRGLTVAQVNELRAQLRDSGAQISANEVLEASEEAEKEKFREILSGPSMMIFAKEDAVSSAKVLDRFAKENEALEIKGGWFEGEFVDSAKIKEISNLPGREEIFGKLLNLLNTPATQLVRILNAPAQQVVQVISASSKKED
ncbi:UNVERIFIED_CONTAM: hypothetical protein GTU68_054514 [Idotea baltica]|nr:hypothetical protein [Idotea baltica]